MLDPGGRIVSWNPSAERFKGYTAQEIIGRHFSRFCTAEDRRATPREHGIATATAICQAPENRRFAGLRTASAKIDAQGGCGSPTASANKCLKG
jgi:PAS domain-containing protein